jgi:hypothetical protein
MKKILLRLVQRIHHEKEEDGDYCMLGQVHFGSGERGYSG